MVPFDQLTAKTILSDEILSEAFDEEDELCKARLLLSLEDRAVELGVKRKFTELVKAYKRVEKEMTRQERERSKSQVTLVDNWTNFDGPYERMQCRSWVASEEGVYNYNSTAGNLDVLACYHPILPVERLKNLETGEEQIRIAYKRNGRWEEIIVPKTMVTSASKIVALSGRGIAVTSENAKNLVRYLADVENANDAYINVQYSSSKLGWIRKDFLPYDTEIIFDGDSRFRQVFDSVSPHGNWDLWLNHVRGLRLTGRMEVKFMMAASFASILIALLGGLPFFVDLWGETEGGKTVTLMLAASIWANPDESRYIGDFKTTDVALEAKADMLNHLPMILDDTSKSSPRIRDNFEGVVYDLCSGKGKSRSNKDLGINRENRWKNCILTNGERPLASYVIQGGAINRILEVECKEKVYEDPQKTAEVIRRNYGMAGPRFVQAVKEMGTEAIREIQNDFLQELSNDEKMQKQSLSLSIVLTADRIATDRIFEDGKYISLEEASEVLIDRNELSDNERCYQYLLDKIAMNQQRFDKETKTEKWGIMEPAGPAPEYAVIFNPAFDELCRSGGFSRKSFLSWAARKGLVQTQGGKTTKTKKVAGNVYRCVFLRLKRDEEMDQYEFRPLSKEEQEVLVFD